MENAQVTTNLSKGSGGLVKSAGVLVKDLFGQLVTATFWKDLLVFTLKTAFRVAGEMAIVAGGHAMIEMGRKFGKGNGPELDAIKEKFGVSTLQNVTPPPAPAASAFSRGFAPTNEYRPTQYPPATLQDTGSWPGLAPNFGR